ncbi:hypothetical protein DRO32_01150 [Candidatus Bathyarchaeota archaeon]|nr:MAG: hypothetical protein DRO32_01150 [Candidatus Bathyarchaeota archaeon]
MEASKAAGAALLAVGIGVMLFTFYCAYGAYMKAVEMELLVTTTANPWQAFTEILGPLIKSCIMVMFLGVMGWAGVVLTSRGVQLFRMAPAVPVQQLPVQVPAATAVPVPAPAPTQAPRPTAMVGRHEAA